MGFMSESFLYEFWIKSLFLYQLCAAHSPFVWILVGAFFEWFLVGASRGSRVQVWAWLHNEGIPHRR